MPITLTPFTHGDLCHGWRWSIDDKQALAQTIANVAVGQSRHVEKIIAGTGLGPPPTTASAVAEAIRMLTVAGPQPYHRDGWMFQVMSWLAAHRASPGALIRTPHMILAHKGFDGLQLEVDDETQRISAAVLFEDKATEFPRRTVRDVVWPEFKEFEDGRDTQVLVAESITLLSTRSTIDPDQAIRQVIWDDVRRYRVSVTIDNAIGDDDAHRALFGGYDTVAAGAVERRRGETLLVDDLRPWMADLALRAIGLLNGLGGAADVRL